MLSNNISISINGLLVNGSGGETYYLLAQNGDRLLAQNGDFLLAQNGAPTDYTPTLFVLGHSYITNQPVFYINTTGDSYTVDVTYILTANKNLPNYSVFNIADWNVISTKVWVCDSTNILLQKYQTFPGDIVMISDLEIVVTNDTSGIVTADQLFDNPYVDSTYVDPYIAQLIITPFALLGTYPLNSFVRYTRTSGLVTPRSVDYILRSKSVLTAYTPFNIFDWEIVTNYIWTLTSAEMTANNYDILSGDIVYLT